MKTPKALVAGATLLLLAACSAPGGGYTQAPIDGPSEGVRGPQVADLIGTWEVTSFTTREGALTLEAHPRLTFAEGALRADLGCTLLEAEGYTLDGAAALRLRAPREAAGQTCPSPRAREEAAVLAHLLTQGPSTLAFDNSLVLVGSQETLKAKKRG